jgi:hypothetical protein
LSSFSSASPSVRLKTTTEKEASMHASASFYSSCFPSSCSSSSSSVRSSNVTWEPCRDGRFKHASLMETIDHQIVYASVKERPMRHRDDIRLSVRSLSELLEHQQKQQQHATQQ